MARPIKYFRMTYYVMLVKLIPFERKSHLKFLLIPEILLYIFPLMKIRQSLSLTPVSKILKIHVDPYKSTFLRTTDTSLREEVTTHTNTELLTALSSFGGGS